MGIRKLVVELTSLCNLDCDYCFKQLGGTHLDVGLLDRILRDAREWGASKVTYTGGEVSLYPELQEALRTTRDLGYRYALVTNGWHFTRLLPGIENTRNALKHIFFSLDSVTEALHDGVRGTGSHKRIMTAVDLCRERNLPFSFLAVVTQRNLEEVRELALFAQSAGAAGIRFGHLLPTSEKIDADLALSYVERRAVEAMVGRLESELNIAVSFSASASSSESGACCESLAGQALSIDCHGRLSLCCQLADYRGSATNRDIVADLKNTAFGNAYAGFLALALKQRNCRDRALALGEALAEHPCDFCIDTMEKTGWNASQFPTALKGMA
jgi:MoaA/NifB/PqqE/SkfB family radical SAM enzyme